MFSNLEQQVLFGVDILSYISHILNEWLQLMCETHCCKYTYICMCPKNDYAHNSFGPEYCIWFVLHLLSSCHLMGCDSIDDSCQWYRCTVNADKEYQGCQHLYSGEYGWYTTTLPARRQDSLLILVSLILTLVNTCSNFCSLISMFCGNIGKYVA